MDAEISEKLLPKEFIKNTVLSTRLRAEKSIEDKSKFYQKSLTQACQILSLNEKSPMLESVIFDKILAYFFMNFSALRWTLKSQKKCYLKNPSKIPF